MCRKVENDEHVVDYISFYGYVSENTNVSVSATYGQSTTTTTSSTTSQQQWTLTYMFTVNEVAQQNAQGE